MNTPDLAAPMIQKMLEDLRSEAADVKHCFTQFSFAVMTFGSALFAVILQFSGSKPYVGFIGVLMAVICIYTARIGNHKYGTANRNYAYELHLYRLVHYAPVDDVVAGRQMLHCGWEEAMFAWRIVSSTIRDQLYARENTSKMRPWRVPILRAQYRTSVYPWFDTKLLAQKDRNYSPGRYLLHMHSILNILAIASLAVGTYSGIRLIERSMTMKNWEDPFVGVAAAIILAVVLPWSIYQIWANRQERKLLESGLFSIQSSAVLWRCTVIAHFRALEKSTRFMHYTANLCLQAEDLAKQVLEVHSWMAGADEFPSKRCVGFSTSKPNVP